MFFRLALLSLLTILTSCQQVENSSAKDASIYGEITGTPAFMAARTVLIQKCSNCHLYHDMYEEEIVQAGLVVPGNANASLLYYRLQGSSGTGGPKDMPSNGTIAASQLTTVETWINAITQ